MPSSSPEHFLCGPSLAPCGLSRAWAEIDIAALVDNARVCLEAAGPGGGLMAILKADAYGHGVGPVARALESHVRAFGVAGVAEAQELARALPQGAGGRPAREILVLGPLYPGEREALVQGGFSASLSQVEEVRALADGVTHGRSPVPVHAVADTGMGRMGARGGRFSNSSRRFVGNPPCAWPGLLPISVQRTRMKRPPAGKCGTLKTCCWNCGNPAC